VRPPPPRCGQIKYHELALAEEAARRRMGREREEEEAEVARYRVPSFTVLFLSHSRCV
jgi:hypothetical protein